MMTLIIWLLVLYRDIVRIITNNPYALPKLGKEYLWEEDTKLRKRLHKEHNKQFDIEY